MRWLIIPDIHDKIRRANQIIEREPHEHLLLMGDFFDDFQTGVTDAADTAKRVKEWLNAPNTTCLLGNHDMSYGWGRQNRRLICAGYDAAKWITINGIVTSRDWQRFKLHTWLEGDERPWLVSHAGIHPCWLGVRSRTSAGMPWTSCAPRRGNASIGANITRCLDAGSAAPVIRASAESTGWIGMSWCRSPA